MTNTVPTRVDVLDSNQSLPLDISTHTLKVSYPPHWFAPVPLSRFARTIEEETINWMDRLGLMPDERVRTRVRAMEPRYYAGYSNPMATYEHALMQCKLLTMWLLWDDNRVEIARNLTDLEPPLDALAGDSIDPHRAADPYVEAFRHLGDEYERLGASRAWRARFADQMKSWARHAISEEQVRRSGSQDAPNRPFEEALRLRTMAIGFIPASVPLERVVGIEVPQELHGDLGYQRLIEHAASICCMVNDMVGVAKDISNDQARSNLVLYNRLFFRRSILAAYQDTLRIHDEVVAAYDALAADLLDRASPAFRERLAVFIDYLRYMNSGFGFWHCSASRFQRLVAVENGRAFRMVITSRNDVAHPPVPAN